MLQTENFPTSSSVLIRNPPTDTFDGPPSINIPAVARLPSVTTFAELDQLGPVHAIPVAPASDPSFHSTGVLPVHVIATTPLQDSFSNQPPDIASLSFPAPPPKKSKSVGSKNGGIGWTSLQVNQRDRLCRKQALGYLQEYHTFRYQIEAYERAVAESKETRVQITAVKPLPPSKTKWRNCGGGIRMPYKTFEKAIQRIQNDGGETVVCGRRCGRPIKGPFMDNRLSPPIINENKWLLDSGHYHMENVLRSEMGLPHQADHFEPMDHNLISSYPIEPPESATSF